MADKRMMNLTVFMLAPGYHFDSWRMPGSRAEELGKFGLIKDLTQRCEAAKVDAVFFGDVVTAGPIPGAEVRTSGFNEPITSLSALSSVTENIGLIGTASTTFSDPFVLARLFNGLDNLSEGRAGWNIVTSGSGGENFGYDEHPHPTDRYRRAQEFVKVVTELWDSWSDDAVIVDREAGWWADPDKIKAINHVGEFFKVKGPLNMRRSPQGHPVKFQAGSSSEGMDLGTSIADAIYTAQPIKEEAIKFYNEFKDTVKKKGRNPEQVKIFPGIMPILGETQKDAEELAKELGDHILIEIGRKRMEEMLKVGLGDLDLDAPIPADRWSEDPHMGSRYHIFRRRVQNDNLTLRELIILASRSAGHQFMIGTASAVADRMIDWFDARACDGFSLNPTHMPGAVSLLCDLLIPELQERGYYKTEYLGPTLRDNLGLSRPAAWDKQ